MKEISFEIPETHAKEVQKLSDVMQATKNICKALEKELMRAHFRHSDSHELFWKYMETAVPETVGMACKWSHKKQKVTITGKTNEDTVGFDDDLIPESIRQQIADAIRSRLDD